MERLERWSRGLAALGDGTAGVVTAIYRALGRPGRLLQDLLNGSFLGHALHPVLTDVTIGGFTMVVALDLVALIFHVRDLETATRIVLGLTLLATLGTILTGLTDYKDTASGDERNVATLHGWTNIAATVVYAVAFFLRLAGAVAIGQVLGLLAYLVVSGGAYIGGHLVFKYGYMVNRNAFAGGKRAKDFTAVLAVADLPDQTPTKAMLGTTALVVVRRGDLVFALKDTCSHAGGPLSGGTLTERRIVCPWHASEFRLADGAVRHGPATTRQPAYRARVTDGQIEVQGPIR